MGDAENTGPENTERENEKAGPNVRVENTDPDSRVFAEHYGFITAC